MMKKLDDFIKRFPSLEESQVVSDQSMNELVGGGECSTYGKVKCRRGNGGVNNNTVVTTPPPTPTPKPTTTVSDTTVVLPPPPTTTTSTF